MYWYIPNHIDLCPMNYTGVTNNGVITTLTRIVSDCVNYDSGRRVGLNCISSMHASW